MGNLAQLIQAFFKALLAALQKTRPKVPTPPQPQPVPVVVHTDPPPAPVNTIFPPVEPPPQSSGFLTCPIQANDTSGKPVTSRTVRISGVVDHSDTAIDPNSAKRWGLHAKDLKVKTFNGEIGDGEASAEAPLGYTKQSPAPFFANSEINYVGAHSSKDKYGPTFYLNYDGHAGFDFSYAAMTPILATAEGILHKASNAEDTIYGQGWDVHHTFCIKHSNRYSTWYRHCTKLANNVEAQLTTTPTKTCSVAQGQVVAYVGSFGAGGAVHLHLEVRDQQGKIVDPYGDKLWKE